MVVSIQSQLPASEDGLIKTLNGMGFMYELMDEYKKSYLDYVACVNKPVLDVGAAYGASVLAALEKGAVVIANDMDRRHLAILCRNTPRYFLNQLTLRQGVFPIELDFPENSLSAILCSQLMHFLSPDDIEIGLKKMFSWLEPGGKVFAITSTPYLKSVEKYIPVYISRKKAGDRWSGLFENKYFFPRPQHWPTAPKYIHFLDESLLVRCFTEAGFEIEKSSEFARRDFPEERQLDGRENVGIIAVKPQL